jgi:uncharacterized paraquat-inducible protein A
MSTRMQLLCLILVSLAVAAATAHLRQPARKLETRSGQRFLYCPECELEIAVPAEMEPKQTFCPHCGVTKPMQINSYSRTNGAAPPLPNNRLLMAAMFGVPAALLLGLYSLSRKRPSRQASGADEVFQFSCPGCHHTMASNSYRKGSTAVCPVCAELFVVTGSDKSDATVDRPDEERDLEDGLRSRLRKKKPRRPRRPRS